MTRPATIAALRALAADLLQDAQTFGDEARDFEARGKVRKMRSALIKERSARLHHAAVESAISILCPNITTIKDDGHHEYQSTLPTEDPPTEDPPRADPSTSEALSLPALAAYWAGRAGHHKRMQRICEKEGAPIRAQMHQQQEARCRQTALCLRELAEMTGQHEPR